jgi:predicted Fe-Mo cluster-binding NifX family protein
MKVAVAAAAPDLDAGIAPRLGTCACLLMVEAETMKWEALPAPPGGGEAGSGTGVAVVALALANDAEAIIAGYVSPKLAGPLRRNGVDVVTSSGAVRGAVEKYARGELRGNESLEAGESRAGAALKRSARQFASVFPVLLGVVMLVGLFKALVTKDTILSVLTGHPLLDTFFGAALGSISAGNPVNSYVIGDALLSAGVGLSAVTAVMLTWVSVGLVQLPAEISALGTRFAVCRTAAAFLVSVGAAFLTALLVGALT